MCCEQPARPYCEDCKHFVRTTGSFRYELGRCRLAPIFLPDSYVMRILPTSSLMSCGEARSSLSTCGPDGLLFEPKPEPPPPILTYLLRRLGL